MSLREDIEALAAEWEARYEDGKHMVGCPEGAGYYDLLADELRAILTKPPTTPRIRTERRELI